MPCLWHMMYYSSIGEHVLREGALLNSTVGNSIPKALNHSTNLSLRRLWSIISLDELLWRMIQQTLFVEAGHLLIGITLCRIDVCGLLNAIQIRMNLRLIEPLLYLSVVSVAHICPGALHDPQAPVLVQIMPFNICIQIEVLVRFGIQEQVALV